VRSTRSTPRKAAAAAAAAAAAKPSARDAKSRPSVPASPVAAAGSKRKLETTPRGVSKRAAAGGDSPVKVKAEVKEEAADEVMAAAVANGRRGSRSAGKPTKATPGQVKKEPTTAETKSAAAGKGRARPRRGATALRGTRAAKLEPVKGEEASESEESDDDTPVPENEYEAKRRANMERNRAILESLNIPDIPVMERPAAAAPVRARGLGKKAPPERPPPRARSMRLQGLTSEGEKLPDNWREPLRFKPSEAEREEWRERRTGELAVTECAAPDPRAADQEQAKADALAHLDSFATRWEGVRDNPAAARGNSAAAGAKAGAAFAAEMRKLQVGENDVAKVRGPPQNPRPGPSAPGRDLQSGSITLAEMRRLSPQVVPDRIYAMAFHPSEQHTLVAAADKCGRIGLFAPDWADDDSCVMHMQVHSRAVTSLYFDQQAPAALYSSGYDCLVRRLDLEKRVWDEVCPPAPRSSPFASSRSFSSLSLDVCWHFPQFLAAVTERNSSLSLPPPPSRTKWTRLVHPSVLTGHVSGGEVRRGRHEVPLHLDATRRAACHVLRDGHRAARGLGPPRARQARAVPAARQDDPRRGCIARGPEPAPHRLHRHDSRALGRPQAQGQGGHAASLTPY